jgi:hypothetical protein
MHWHHIVEKHTDNLSKFGGEAIHNTLNVIRLPKEIHEKVSGHYASKQFAYTGGKTVREWLKTQSYEEQVKYGIETLKRFGWTP